MPSDRSEDGYEMFTLRVNVEPPTDKPLGKSRADGERRLKFQVRHVNSGEEETRFALDEALDWLRGKVAALFHKRGAPARRPDNPDSAQQ